MIGRAISHYRVLSTLGSGGMGVVYLAEDERLGRQVALKFLPPESLTSRQALDRFRVEARAASSLSHPGICAIYDIGDEDGTPYIVMEALKGESLRDRIHRGPLKVLDLLDIGVQLADALDAAHSQGIIHRDIKPSNIVVGEKNRTKILDFGLAKLAQATTPRTSGETRARDASTHRDLTMPGSALGTVSYMSPEQARGEDVDTRTDLFSLGAVLYEMATGVQAFGGSTQAVVFDSILNRTPHPLAHINPQIPPRLESLIVTALEKDRDLRHQHASDIEAELKRIRRDLESGSLVAVNHSRTEVIPPSERPNASLSGSTPSANMSRSWLYVAAAVVLTGIAIAGFNLWSDTSRVVVTPATDAPPVTTPSIPPAVTTTVPTPANEPVAAQPPPPQAQPPQIASTPPQETKKPNAPESRTKPVQPVAPATPQRSANEKTPAPVVPAPVTLPPPPQANESPVNTPAPQTQTQPPVQTPQPLPTPPVVVEQPPAQPPPRAAAAAAPPPVVPPTSPVESDDALIRAVIRTYERAFETKNVDLYRSIRPSLPPAEEARLRDSFNQTESLQIDLVIEELRVEGRTATARLSRRDTSVIGGRRRTAASRQTLRFEKAGANWIITEIVGR